MVRTLLSRTWPLVAAVGLALSAHAAAPVKLSANTSEVRDFIAVSATVGYAATAGGGLWKTTDAGANWSKTTLAAKTVYKISANSASGGARLYAATDTGLYRSTDSGATWTQLTQDITRAVAVDPLSAAGGPDTILFGVTGAGVYKSTDNGTTITRVSGTPPNALDSTDVLGIVYYPGQSAVAYVVLQCNVEDAPAPLSGEWGGVWRTANANTAAPSWALMTGLPNVDSTTRPCASAIAANGTTVVVGIKDYSTNQGGTYRVTSSAATVFATSASNPQPFGVEWLGPDFSNANGFFLGSNQFGPYRSSNAGANFAQIYTAAPNDPDFVALSYASGAFTATTWVAGINGLGLFRTTTGASPWNLPTTPIKADRVNDLSNHNVGLPATYYMAVKNGGVQRSTNSGSTWAQFNTGLDSVYSFLNTGNFVRNVEVIGAHPNNGNVVGLGMRAFGLYQATGGATSWAQVAGFVNAVDHKPQSFVISPAGKVFYTLFDSGAATPGGLFQANATATTIGTLASSGKPIFEAAPQLGVAPAAGRIRLMPTAPEQKIYMIMYNSLPYVSSDFGASFSRVTVNPAYREGGFQRHAFFDVTEKPSNTAIVVAPTNHGIYKSTDFGATWSYVNATGLPSTALSSMVYHAGGTLFGGDWSGLIYCSTDDGSTWTAVGNTQSSIKDMKYLNGAVHILTDGAGVWTKDNTCP